jgi:hypothetical protein
MGRLVSFKATDFEARSDVAYRVKVQAIRTVRFGVLTSIITAEKTITVTVTLATFSSVETSTVVMANLGIASVTII